MNNSEEQEYLKTRSQYRFSLAAAVGAIFFGSLFYHAVEKWSYLNSTYFSVVTLSTVGYGDFAPKTSAGKIFTIAYIIIGIGILTTFIQALVRNRMARRNWRQSKRGSAQQ